MKIILLYILILLSLSVQSQGFLHTKGTMIVDGNENEIIFRGMGLGGWMLQEPYMLKASGLAYAQHDIRKKIVSLIGEERTKKFYRAWLDNHCTKADIDSLAAWGFNSVRLPMHFGLYTLPVEQEPVKGKQTWIKEGFELTDKLLKWCSANKIYLILDLHAAPGGQGNDNPIADRDTARASLWQDEKNKIKTIALWKKLAERYKNETWIGGYDIINEPNWGFSEKAGKNGCDEKENIPLRKLMVDITNAIRSVDKNHIIFIEGNCWGNNYEGVFPLWDNNTVISFHKYWNYNDKASIQKYLDYRAKLNVPVWLGETGENSNAWFTDVITMLEANRIGWTMWPLKKSGLNNLMEIKVNPGMQSILDYWQGKIKPPFPDEAYNALMQYAKNTNVRNVNIRYDVIDAMNRQVATATVIPYKKHIAQNGAVVFAVDYDFGRSGIAYHDNDSAEYWVSTNKRTGWNRGGQYRNDGVDIEPCSDKQSNGFNIGWIEKDEWVQYTVYSPGENIFDLQVRTAAKDQAGQLQLIVNEKLVNRIAVPVTGENQNWQSTTIPQVKLDKGWNRIRVKAESGGFNLNYLQFKTPEHGE